MSLGRRVFFGLNIRAKWSTWGSRINLPLIKLLSKNIFKMRKSESFLEFLDNVCYGPISCVA